VQDLLKKIEAAAQARLSFSPSATPAEKLARYKNFLKVETHRLKLLHRAGGSGIQVCQGRAAILDVLLMHFWETPSVRSRPGARGIPPIALVAIGGYGRAELNPHSDIDFMSCTKTSRGRQTARAPVKAYRWRAVPAVGHRAEGRLFRPRRG